MTDRKVTHAEIQDNLPAFLRAQRRNQGYPFPVVTEVALGGSFSSEGRLDAAELITAKRYTVLYARGFEIKASRSDLLQDLRKNKWRKYLPYTEQFYFVLREGIAKASEIPAECGVIIYTPSVLGRTGTFRYTRGAKRTEAKGFGAGTVARIALKLAAMNLKDQEALADLRWRMESLEK